MIKVVMDKQDLATLLMASVRYSMGRKTYMPEYVMSMVLKYGPLLGPEDLSLIAKEIRIELEAKEAVGSTLGHKCDHESWKKGLEALSQFL